MTVRFDDLEDFDAPGTAPSSGINVPRGIEDVKKAIHIEDCPKCNGTGRYSGYSSHGRQCFKCGGTGKLQFKASKDQRERSRAKAQTRRANAQVTNLERFEQANPAIAAWWNGTDFAFAQAMKVAAMKYGDLTERQMDSCLRCVESAKAYAAKQLERAEQAAQVATAAPTIEVSAVDAALERGRDKGIRKPIMRLAGENGAAFVFSLAWSEGVNAGAVYVNGPHREYYGKIVAGKFIKGRDCSDDTEAGVIGVCANPETSAIAYGRQFGICSCCGRELTNKLSISLGIGPICRSKFF